MCDEGRVEAKALSSSKCESLQGTDCEHRRHREEGSGQSTCCLYRERKQFRSLKVKSKGPPARVEQVRTEEMKVITLLVTFELGVIILISKMTKSRHTKTK